MVEKGLELRDFMFERVLKHEIDSKIVYVQGTMRGKHPADKALLKLEQTAFDEKDIFTNDTSNIILGEDHYF